MRMAAVGSDRRGGSIDDSWIEQTRLHEMNDYPKTYTSPIGDGPQKTQVDGLFESNCVFFDAF